MKTSFKEWLNEKTENIVETSGDAVEGSINKLIEIMKGKKDSDSKEILTQAKGLLKTFKKTAKKNSKEGNGNVGGISRDQAKWLYDTWTALKGS